MLDLGKGIKIELAMIPAGKFLMGSDSGNDNEKPVHEVKILIPFYMGVSMVTQAQYQSVMRSNPSDFKGDQLPVETVNWYNIVEFCSKLSQKTGRKVRLPSEAEWEYACRAGSRTKYCFGDDEERLEEYAWSFYNSGCKTHLVKQKMPNAWGLHDMHGNVLEYCQDYWVANYAGAPSNGLARMTGDSYYRVIRGGSWTNQEEHCRSASRNKLDSEARSRCVGFRIVVASAMS